jgi:CRISPR-associated endonuclease/helicase Cas3
MNDIILYAKSKNQFGQVTLLQHLLDTEKAVNEVFKDGSRLCKAWIRFFQIEQNQEKLLWKTLRVAALLHDIGKANEDFQQAVSHPGSVTQSIRHEHLSALILCSPEIREWLKNGGVDPDIVIAAVLSHHIKAKKSNNEFYGWGKFQGNQNNIIKLYFNNIIIIKIFNKIKDILNLTYIPNLGLLPISLSKTNYQNYINKYKKTLTKFDIFFYDQIKWNTNDKKICLFLLAIKSGLVICDSVSSGIIRENKILSQWIDENIHFNNVLENDINNIIFNKKGPEFKLNDFQKNIIYETDRSLLLASCGSGKTFAAWNWAKQQIINNEFGRVIFLYPTRGTATEGFIDYIGFTPDGILEHSSSKYELSEMIKNPKEPLEKDNIISNELESKDRLFALGLWKYKFYSATVDQFLSFMQNNYKSLCLLPALSDSVIIFDEVHSYDNKMFELLLSFLKFFNIPSLCMTATIQPKRLNKLKDAGLIPYPNQQHNFKDLQDKSNVERYDIYKENDIYEAINTSINEYKNGKKVLIVVNKVKTCQKISRYIKEKYFINPYIYHSRFKLKDRQYKHRTIIDGFKSNNPVIAITTQVCEMSLDIDANILVTEFAPITSLIQRFGRSNRHNKYDSSKIYVCLPEDNDYKPYKSEDIDGVKGSIKFVEKIIGKCSQSKLAELLEAPEFCDDNKKEYNYTGFFINGGYYAQSDSLRQEDYVSGIQCICDDDINIVLTLLDNKQPIDGFFLPVPEKQYKKLHIQKEGILNNKLPKYIEIISSKGYDKEFGLDVR